MRISLAVGLCGGLLLAIAAYGYRYEPPPMGRLVLDTLLDPAAQVQHLPLRLSRTGRYYAEIMLESAAAVAAPATLELSVTFTRREQVLFTRSMHVELRPAAPAQTLFWLEVPRDLPEHTRLDVALAATARAPAGSALRFQLTRKLELLAPHPPR